MEWGVSPVQTESDLFATAAHEAGHAIVARMLGLRVAFLKIAADGSGKSSIESAHHLEIADQIAVYTAGSQAVKLLGFEQRRQAGDDDHGKVTNCSTPTPRQNMITCAPRGIAERLKFYETTVAR